MQVQGLELPQQRKRGRPTLKDRTNQVQSQAQPLASPNTRKRRRSERDSSGDYAEEAKKSNKRGRGRLSKVDTPITESRSSIQDGENDETAAQLQPPQATKPPPKKQHTGARVNSHHLPKKALRATPANPSTFVYNFKVEAKRLSPAGRSIRRQQLELELAALQAADQEEEDDQ
jgi:hypothetical protein